MEIPNYVQRVLELLRNSGYESYLVGGCVRDMLLGKNPHDYDVCTSALPNEILSTFASYTALETGIQHGTVTVVIDKEPVEVTTFREDGSYSDGRHPDSVTFSRKIEDDLARRDFTINAIAYYDRIIDPFGGREDLKAGIIRCVGDARRRFQEDALRILRAIRFSCKLGFQIDDETKQQMLAQGHRLALVSIERQTSELMQMLSTGRVRKPFDEFSQILIQILYCANAPKDWVKLVDAVDLCPSKIVKLAVLYYSDAEYTKHLQRLKLSGTTYRAVRNILDNMNASLTNEASIKLAFYEIGDTTTLNLLATLWGLSEAGYIQSEVDYKNLLACGNRIKQSEQCYSLDRLAIGGGDIKTIFPDANKEIGEILDKCVRMVISDKICNRRNDLLEFVKNYGRIS